MSSKSGGRATFKGINAQAWAALSLFLQYVRSSDLEYIAFEQEKLKDFDLVFSSKKKIICESKAKKITHADVKKILDKLIDNSKVDKKDEILIICQKVNPETKNDIENLKYYESLKAKLKKKSFTDKHLELFSRIKFWEVDKKTNELVTFSLLSEILGVWVPDKTFSGIVSDLLVNKIYNGSQNGAILTKKEFYELIDEKKNQVQIDSGYKDEQSEKLARIDKILSAINKPTSRDWCNNEISLLTTTPDIYYLTIKKLEGLTALKLEQWDNLWKASTKGTFSLHIFDIFQKNISDPENQKYLMNFLPSTIDSLVSFYRQEFFAVDVAKICSSIIDSTRNYDYEIFNLLKNLIELSKRELFYVKRNDRDEWEQEKTTEVLKKLYETTNDTVKQKIVDFIFSFYNLVQDDGQFWHYTPNTIFEILKLYIELDIENRILTLSKILSKQYELDYMKYSGKTDYKGWENIGFTNTDRHFITYVLQPVLNQYYSTDPDKAWIFVKDKLITRKESQVTSDHPDYLNRACISVILNAYQNPSYKKEALGIIKDFVEMRKGIPHKTEVIYRQVQASSMTNEDKWELVKIQINYKPYGGLPVNEHVEKIVSELANTGHLEALNILESWSKNPEYNKYKGPLEGNITSIVPGLLANPKTKQRGISILRDFLNSDYFINKQGTWDVWETARVLTQVLTNEFIDGKTILNEIWSKDSLSKNQQIVITSCINDADKNDQLITNIYNEIVSGWLDDIKDNIHLLISKIPDIQSRNSFVQFGDKLAKAKQYEAALRFAKIFINDPDPSLENDEDDPEGKHNYHELVKNGEDLNQITTVRVWVAWILHDMAVLHGRKYIPDVIPLVEKLTTDLNYYVRAYACIPLEQLVRVRHTVLPQDKNTRFITLKSAEKIEHIAYTMLRNKENWSIHQVMMGLLRTFSNIRSVTVEEAKEILQTFLNTKNNKIIEEARVLFIFFAEFRSESIKEENLIHVYAEKRLKALKIFDDKYFKDLLVKVISDYPAEVKAGFAWAFWHLPKEPGADFEKCFGISIKYLSILVKKYEHEVMTDVYYFIEEFINQKPTECLNLWMSSLKVEKPYLTKAITKENLYSMHWWPYHYNGKILVKLAEVKGNAEFLTWLEYLLDYPDGVLIANDLGVIIDKLVTLPVDIRSKSIFEKFVTRNPEYYERMKSWLT